MLCSVTAERASGRRDELVFGEDRRRQEAFKRFIEEAFKSDGNNAYT